MSNILFTYITPFHPLKGGIGRVTDTLTREFLKRGHRVYYMIYKSAVTVGHEYDYPVPLVYLPSRELLSEDNVHAYLQFVEEHQIEFVINQSGNFSDSALWLKASSEKTKVISALHQEPWVSYKHFWHDFIPLKNCSLIERCKQIVRVLLYPRMKRLSKKWRVDHFNMLLPKTDKVCMLTERYYKQVSEICPGYESKYYAIPNANSYSSPEIPSWVDLIEKKKKQIISVGLLVRNKRVDRAIRIWKKIEDKYPDWEFMIVGDGAPEYVDYLHSLASQCKRLRFVGQSDPKPYYESASILMHTTNYEGWPMVLTEAMQFGVVPVVFDASDSFYDILNEGECGVLVKSYDLKSFQMRLESLMNNCAMRRSISGNAYEHVKKYDAKTIGDMWETLFDNLS